MAKLLVKNKETGETRPMTKSSFDLAGHKRGFVVVGTHEEEKPKGSSQSPSDVVKEEMARLKAEKAAKEEKETVVNTAPDSVDEAEEPQKPVNKRGPKSKKTSDEV